MFVLASFLFFILLIFVAGTHGISGVWVYSALAWVLAIASYLSPLARVLFAVSGGTLFGILDQSSWWFQAAALGIPLILFEWIGRHFFIVNPFWREVLTGTAAMILWAITLFLGELFGLDKGVTLASFVAMFGVYIMLVGLIFFLQNLYKRVYAR